MLKLGYTLSSEEHSPPHLVRYAQRAERAGFEFALISDHYHPWIDSHYRRMGGTEGRAQGHSQGRAEIHFSRRIVTIAHQTDYRQGSGDDTERNHSSLHLRWPAGF